jgi:hypothetical protein
MQSGKQQTVQGLVRALQIRVVMLRVRPHLVRSQERHPHLPLQSPTQIYRSLCQKRVRQRPALVPSHLCLV